LQSQKQRALADLVSPPPAEDKKADADEEPEGKDAEEVNYSL